MKKHYYLVDKLTGNTEVLEEISDEIDKNQIVIVEGVDSEFVERYAVGYKDGQSISYGEIVVTKYTNSDNDELLSVVVGGYTISYIKRVAPKIEFEFQYKNNSTKEDVKRVFNSFQEGLKKLATDQ